VALGYIAMIQGRMQERIDSALRFDESSVWLDRLLLIYSLMHLHAMRRIVLSTPLSGIGPSVSTPITALPMSSDWLRLVKSIG